MAVLHVATVGYWDLSGYLDILLRLFCAVILGGIIGLERAGNNQDAGIRTHILVCLGAAGIMTISETMAGEFGGDIGRLGAQVVSGIGFLGAGCIMTRGNHIRGLTTAAGLWATSCIGLACGMGYYHISITVTALLMIATLVLRPISSYFKKKEVQYRYKIRIRMKKREEFTDISEIFTGTETHVEAIEREEDNIVVLSVVSNSENSASQLICTLMENKKILEVNRM